jgi:hypothetical protein
VGVSFNYHLCDIQKKIGLGITSQADFLSRYYKLEYGFFYAGATVGQSIDLLGELPVKTNIK